MRASYAGDVDPAVWPAVVIGAVVLALAIFVLWALAAEKPDPAEAAIAYEEAWDRLDFDLLWRLSAPELREGRDRQEFVAAKGELYRERADLAGLVGRVVIGEVDLIGRHARAFTTLELRDGTALSNQMRLRREGNRWSVVDYRLGAG